VSTLDAEGLANLAPFSFFGGVTAHPPIVMVSIGRRDGRPKDTAANLLATGEGVVHICHRPLGQAMGATAASLAPCEDEFDLAGLAKTPSTVVALPRVDGAAVALEAKSRRAEGASNASEALERITTQLPRESLERYETLRQRAQELRQIATDLRPQIRSGGRMPFEDLQLRGLDRLLWIYLRLLYTEWSLSRFFERTSEQAIQSDILRLEQKLAGFQPEEENPRRQKARQTLEDNLATSRARLANLQKAHENHELVQLEIDRLENKIRSLSELAVNRQEPEFISDQVDSVAESMLETERTMNDLRFATGLVEIDEEIPELVTRRTVTTQGG